jgi:hypothetical protein
MAHISNHTVIGRGSGSHPKELQPIAMPVKNACRIGGFGETTAWKLIANGTLESVLVGRRRLILYASLIRLLTPSSEGARRAPRGRGQQRKQRVGTRNAA